jgi:hypothetical protein
MGHNLLYIYELEHLLNEYLYDFKHMYLRRVGRIPSTPANKSIVQTPFSGCRKAELRLAYKCLKVSFGSNPAVAEPSIRSAYRRGCG